MSARINVGILGATGMVGQNYVCLLEYHPLFNVTCVAASPGSAGKTYADAVAGRWLMNREVPEAVRNLRVRDAGTIRDVHRSCVFWLFAVPAFYFVSGNSERILNETHSILG